MGDWLCLQKAVLAESAGLCERMAVLAVSEVGPAMFTVDVG